MSHFSITTAADLHGVSFTCSKPESIAFYNESIMQFLHLTDWTGDGNGLLIKALKNDSYFFMAHIYIGTNMVRSMDINTKNDEKIKKIIEECERLERCIKPKLQQNELLYFEAFKCLFRGQTRKALSAWTRIVELNPLDILALLYLHYEYMAIGQIDGVLSSISCVVDQYEKAQPVTLPYVHGLYGMALEENYKYSEAMKYVDLSLGADPYIVTASHAKAHILGEFGDYNGAIRYLSDNERFWRNNVKMHHVEWHWMLSCIEVGKYAEALALFDDSYLNKNKNKIKDSVRLRDAASFLWRLELKQFDFDNTMRDDIAYRWKLCKKFISADMNERFVAIYHDSYYLLNLIKNEPHTSLKYVDAIKECSAENVENKTKNTYLTETCPFAAIPVFDALCSGYAGNEYGAAFDSMYDVLITDDNKWRMGGSRAQKDVFSETLIDLGFKAKRFQKVKSLLNGQLKEKPILCANSLNLMSRLYEEGYGDCQTADIYKKIRVDVINQQNQKDYIST